MPLSVGVHVSASDVSSPANTLTTASRTLAGSSYVLVWAHSYQTGTLSTDDDVSITDSQGNTYLRVTASKTGFGSDGRRSGSWYYFRPVNAGATTWTYTAGLNDYLRLHVIELLGADNTAAPDQASATTGNAVTNLTSPNITTTLANEILLLGGFDSLASATASFADGSGSAATGGWTILDALSDASTEEGAVAYAIVSSTGTFSGKYTESGAAGNLGVSLISVKAAAGAATQPPYQPWQQRAPILAQ